MLRKLLDILRQLKPHKHKWIYRHFIVKEFRYCPYCDKLQYKEPESWRWKTITDKKQHRKTLLNVFTITRERYWQITSEIRIMVKLLSKVKDGAMNLTSYKLSEIMFPWEYTAISIYLDKIEKILTKVSSRAYTLLSIGGFPDEETVIPLPPFVDDELSKLSEEYKELMELINKKLKK